MASFVTDDFSGKLVTDSVASSGVIFTTTGAVVPAGTSITLIETGGTGAESTQGKVLAYRRPNVQVTARGTTAAAARTTAYAALASLGALSNVTLGSNRYRSVRALQEPFDDGRDEKGNFKYKFNLAVEYDKR